MASSLKRLVVGRPLPTSPAPSRQLDAARDGAVTTVVLPEFAADHAWESGLHNQVLLLLAGELRRHSHTVVVTYPYRAEDESATAGCRGGGAARPARSRARS